VEWEIPPRAGENVRVRDDECNDDRRKRAAKQESGMTVKRLSSIAQSKIARLPRAEDGFRAMAERAPQAEALVASWMEPVRPLAKRVYSLRRRIATVVVTVLATVLFVHVVFGANGMVIYKQKRAEFESLQKQIDRVQQENDRYTQQIQGLKTDQKAIEKEAREQMGYAKPGEYVYVPPTPAKATPPANHSAKK
jgi:cell division protein FtsB